MNHSERIVATLQHRCYICRTEINAFPCPSQRCCVCQKEYCIRHSFDLIAERCIYVDDPDEEFNPLENHYCDSCFMEARSKVCDEEQ